MCVRPLDMAQVNAVIAKLKSMGFTPDPMSKEDMADGGELRDRSGADDGRIAHCLILSLHDRSCLSQSSSPSFVSCPITHVQYAARALKQTVRPVSELDFDEFSAWFLKQGKSQLAECTALAHAALLWDVLLMYWLRCRGAAG